MDIFEPRPNASQIADLETQLETMKADCQKKIADMEAKIAALRSNVGIAGGRRKRSKAKKTRRSK